MPLVSTLAAHALRLVALVVVQKRNMPSELRLEGSVARVFLQSMPLLNCIRILLHKLVLRTEGSIIAFMPTNGVVCDLVCRPPIECVVGT